MFIGTDYIYESTTKNEDVFYERIIGEWYIRESSKENMFSIARLSVNKSGEKYVDNHRFYFKDGKWTEDFSRPNEYVECEKISREGITKEQYDLLIFSIVCLYGALFNEDNQKIPNPLPFKKFVFR